LVDSGSDSDISAMAVGLLKERSRKRYSRYLTSLRTRSFSPGGDDELGTLLNGVIKKKLKIIPENVT